jgi:glycosyltransferase involved in cell wall biosynthesis
MLVSIIITCFNRENHIARAIRSAVDQVFPYGDFEVIVVDDYSADHSCEIIEDFGDAVVFLRHDHNRGLPAARNTGIRRARGRYVVHLDSDDYFHAETIAFEHQFLAFNGDWGAVACDYMLVDEHEGHGSRMSAKEHPIACGIMFRKDHLIAIGLYDESMLLCEDEELRARFEERYKIGHIPIPYYRYTRHEENMTREYNRVDEFRRRLAEQSKPSSQ